MQEKKRVVVVDDSMSMRAIIGHALRSDGRFDVVGEAADPFEAREVIKRTNPDVLTLDVEMPRMDGITFLRKIMQLRPMPVVMFSTETHRGSKAAVEALSIGAVDCIGKPTDSDKTVLRSLVDRVHVASTASVSQSRPPKTPPPRSGTHHWNGRHVLIGASTGGVDALERVLGAMPADCPPILITQHMPKAFLESFAERVSGRVAPSVALASSGAPIEQGRIYIAPGGAQHLVVQPRAARWCCGLYEGEKVSGHRPSVDVLFHSAVPHATETVPVLLTGMGRDGAEGMLALRNAGAHTIAQDKASCVVYGMPRVAAELGGVVKTCSLDLIGDAILSATSRIAPMSVPGQVREGHTR